jgi:hypothetical protein
MTEAEIVRYLGKTSLPTILVEGSDDARIYRWLEERIGVGAGTILFCSGRDVLISIYRKRDTFPHGKLAWLADRDMWRFDPQPVDLAGIIFTTGYSIENDLYAGSDIETLLETTEHVLFTRLIRVLCRWFAFEVGEFRAGRPHEAAHHVNRVVDYAAMDLRPDFRTLRSYVEPVATQVDALATDYKLSLRGKTLIQAIVH